MSGTRVADALERVGHKVTRADMLPTDTSALERPGIDVVFIALHGEFGESGEVQKLCEDGGLRYVGSGPLASELGMNKPASKRIFRKIGLSTPDWAVIERSESPESVRAQLENLPLPLVIKPIDGGSTIDVTIARDERTRDAAMEDLVARYSRAMIELYVEGRELTVGILDTEALPVLEIIPAREFYDYSAKYDDSSGTEFVFDHGLDPAVVHAAQEAALTAHRSIGARDLSRTDFILDSNGTLQILEINTIPGLTAHSLVPMAAAEAGIGFEELADRLVKMPMHRQVVCKETVE